VALELRLVDVDALDVDGADQLGLIAAGQGRRDDDGERIPLDVKVGDEVLFAKYAGTEFKLEEEDLLILSEKDILAVIAS